MQTNIIPVIIGLSGLLLVSVSCGCSSTTPQPKHDAASERGVDLGAEKPSEAGPNIEPTLDGSPTDRPSGETSPPDSPWQDVDGPVNVTLDAAGTPEVSTPLDTHEAEKPDTRPIPLDVPESIDVPYDFPSEHSKAEIGQWIDGHLLEDVPDSMDLPPDNPIDSDLGCQTPSTWYEDIDKDGWGDSAIAVTSCTAPEGYVASGGDCDDRDALRHPDSTTDPGFVYGRCGQGRVIDPMSSPTGWAQYLSADDGSGFGEMTAETGSCLGGNGLVLTYDLPTPSSCGTTQCAWVVMRKELSKPIDISGEDYLVFPFNGDSGDPNLNIDIKLQDASNCMIAYQVRNATDLPAKRAMLIPLKWYSMSRSGGCSVNLAAVHAIEIGVVGEPPAGGVFSDDTGRLHLDAMTALKADDIRMNPTFFSCPGSDLGVRNRITQDLLARHKASIVSNGHAFVRSWFEEPTANYWTYNQALLLAIFSMEAVRTENEDFKVAATAVADELINLQRAVTSDPGRWYDLHQDKDPRPGLAPAGDLSFSWYGNTSWVVIALDLFHSLVRPTNSQPYDDAIELAAKWLGTKIDTYGTSGGITEGTEGNISTFFALVAAKHFARAEKLKDYLLVNHWHADERRFWMGFNHPGLAIDVIANWGADFFRAIGETQKALAGLGLAAGLFPAKSFDGTRIGLGDIAGPWQPTVEFSGQFISAGGIGGAYLLTELLKLENNGTFPGAPNDFDGGEGWNTAWHGIAPAASIYLALSPSILTRLSLPGFADDFATDGKLLKQLKGDLIDPYRSREALPCTIRDNP